MSCDSSQRQLLLPQANNPRMCSVVPAVFGVCALYECNCPSITCMHKVLPLFEEQGGIEGLADVLKEVLTGRPPPPKPQAKIGVIIKFLAWILDTESVLHLVCPVGQSPLLILLLLV
jgi:hypothetical protein